MDIAAARAVEREVYRRRAHKAQATNKARFRRMEKPTVETVLYDAVLRRDPCSYCGELTDTRWVDHIEPIAHGGRNHWANLTAACQPCNRRKSAKSLLEAMLR